MEKESKSNFITLLNEGFKEGWLPDRFKVILEGFYSSYKKNIEDHGMQMSRYEPLFVNFLGFIKEQFFSPYQFEPYHERIRKPFDYYTWGIDFLRPLVDMHISSVKGTKHIEEIASLLAKGENVVLLANHQIEADPQAISILLEKSHPKLAEEMIFVAGERVVTDPLAIPFSMGRNLLCIYSKRYIDNPPELKMKKQLHNKRTMELMSQLLSEGGKCIYVAPSGGRDRPNEKGVVEVAPFDPQSIEMFYLMAQKAAKPTHFFPLALVTYNLLPPPQTVQTELGEMRLTQRGGVHLSMGAEIDMENYPGNDIQERQERRKARAEFIWNLVKKQYAQF